MGTCHKSVILVPSIVSSCSGCGRLFICLLKPQSSIVLFLLPCITLFCISWQLCSPPSFHCKWSTSLPPKYSICTNRTCQGHDKGRFQVQSRGSVRFVKEVVKSEEEATWQLQSRHCSEASEHEREGAGKGPPS